MGKNYKLAVVVAILVAIVSSILLITNPFQSKESRYHALMERAEVRFDAKEYSKAVNTYKKAQAVDPLSVYPDIEIAGIYLLKGREEKLTDIVNAAKARLNEAQVSSLLVSIGDYYYDNKEFSAALKYYSDAFELSGDFTANLKIAKTYLQLGNIDQASAALEIDGMDEAFSQDVFTLNQYVAGLSNQEDFYGATSAAAEYFEAGYPHLSINVLTPFESEIVDYWDANYILGRAYFSLGDYEKSVYYLELAEAAGSDSSDLFAFQARAHYLLGDIDTSIELYDRAVLFSQSDDEKRLYLNEMLSKILIDSEKYEKAAQTISLLSEIGSESEIVIDLYYAEVYTLAGDYSRAEEYLESAKKFISQSDQSSDDEGLKYKYHQTYALYYLESENGKVAGQAKVHLNQLDRKGHDPEIEFLWARFYKQTGKKLKAKLACQRTIEYDLDGEMAGRALELLASFE
ncbi:tetratricopeptide repeat protein [Candidatus Dojkabacteria bacterium]|nr:tetratricopeptide repeat protein [Candidatus Dojkabacteria bacterium]